MKHGTSIAFNDKDKAMFYIIYYHNGRIDETQSENFFSKKELLERWEGNKGRSKWCFEFKSN